MMLHAVSQGLLARVRESFAVVFDLECTSLYADFGHILAACIKPIGAEPIVLRLDAYWDTPTNDDAPLVHDLLTLLSQAPLVVGWNIDRFDIPFLRTRKILAISEGRRTEMPQAHFKSYDMLRLRRHLRLHNNRLDTWLNNFTPNRKTDVLPRQWRDAQFFDPDSMDYVVDHCLKDVQGTEEVFRQVWKSLHTLRPKECVI